MKGFKRENRLLSLCGLNCGLCTMKLGGHCGGCGNGNQSCKIARCSLEHGGVEYCFQCPEYPCGKYQDIDKYDSFITHRNQRADLERARSMGLEEYNRVQEEKARILDYLLTTCNDGRRKSLFCTAVNLLELSDLNEAEGLLRDVEMSRASLKERGAYAAELLNGMAESKGVSLRLRRRK